MVLGQRAQHGPVGEGGLAFQRCLPASIPQCDSLTPLGLSQTIVHDVPEGIRQQQEVISKIQEKSAKFYYPLFVLWCPCLMLFNVCHNPL